jgi:hypothetical protein
LLISSLCGGIDTANKEHFEGEGLQTYDKVVEGLKTLGKSPSIYTPNGKVFINGGGLLST